MIRFIYNKYFVSLFIILILLSVNAFVYKNFIQNSIYWITQKPTKYLNERFVYLARISRALIGLGGILDENKTLVNQNQELLKYQAEVEKLNRQNAELRERLGLNVKINDKIVETIILNISRNNLISTILVDKGSSDGINKSSAVVNGHNILLGLISELYSNSSLVNLLDDLKSSISVKIILSDNSGEFVIGSARGLGFSTGMAGIELVTNREEVAEGDLVVTSGLDGLPESLVVGKVVSSELKGGNLFRQIKVKLSFDPIINPNLLIYNK